ncbi:uncharacterized protein LOC142229425 [Haematobia irritans]|uniref:uncharacterized protein LOC142229425 n=1 Tax=Haematobia irritans TaxID=7368 RepID=UPI003F508AB3
MFSINENTPTHYGNTSSTLLDLFLLTTPSKCISYDQLSSPLFSRHDIIFLAYDFSVEISCETITYRDFRNVDYHELLRSSQNVPWCDVYQMPNIDDKVIFFERNINKVYDEVVHVRTRCVRTEQQPWFTHTIMIAIGKRDEAYARWRRFKTSRLHDEFKILRREVVRMVRDAKCSYFGRKFGGAISSQQKWRQIRDIGIGNVQDDTCQEDPDELNMRFLEGNVALTDDRLLIPDDDVFPHHEETFSFSCVSQNDTFKSILAIKSSSKGIDGVGPRFVRIILPLILPYITHIFNHILTTSTYPKSWKRAKIIPIPKTKVEYRPISLLPFFSKALENIVFQQMNEFIAKHDLLTDGQSGFRKGRSCTTVLVDMIILKRLILCVTILL